MEFDELLEHLRDLRDLALSEGYVNFSRALCVALACGECDRAHYSRRNLEPSSPATGDADAARDQRFPRNVRES